MMGWYVGFGELVATRTLALLGNRLDVHVESISRYL